MVLHPTRYNTGHFRDVPQANLLAWYVKTKLDTTKAHIHHQKNCTGAIKMHDLKMMELVRRENATHDKSGGGLRPHVTQWVRSSLAKTKV